MVKTVAVAYPDEMANLAILTPLNRVFRGTESAAGVAQNGPAGSVKDRMGLAEAALAAGARGGVAHCVAVCDPFRRAAWTAWRGSSPSWPRSRLL